MNCSNMSQLGGDIDQVQLWRRVNLGMIPNSFGLGISMLGRNSKRVDAFFQVNLKEFFPMPDCLSIRSPSCFYDFDVEY